MMKVDNHVFYHIPLSKLLPSQFDHALRKYMSSFYIFLKKNIFLSLEGGSGHEMRSNVLCLC